jgi:hypothetical protein
MRDQRGPWSWTCLPYWGRRRRSLQSGTLREWSILLSARTIMGNLGFLHRPSKEERGEAVITKPTGMIVLMLPTWLSRPATAAWRALEALSEGGLVARMNKFTLLGDAKWAFGRAAESSGVGEAGRRQRLAGIHDPGGERRHLFGAGEGPAEAVAEAKQDWVVMPEICVNFVSVATGKSLLAPLVTHLSTTCNPRF